MSRNKICVYPHQCQFPNCNCDQPHKAEKHQPVYPNTGVWPYISPEKGGVAGRAYNPNPFDNRYKEFITPPNNPPVDVPVEAQDPKNRHGCDYLDCGCQAPCTATQTVKERFVLYVGVLHMSKDVAEEHIKAVKANISKGDANAIWYVLSDDTTTVSRIVRV